MISKHHIFLSQSLINLNKSLSPPPKAGIYHLKLEATAQPGIRPSLAAALQSDLAARLGRRAITLLPDLTAAVRPGLAWAAASVWAATWVSSGLEWEVKSFSFLFFERGRERLI